jgi:hypothetical protein
LILEDDFFLPPHFPLLFRHAWPALPPYEASSNSKVLLYSECYTVDILGH